MPTGMGGPILLCIAFLLFSPDGTLAENPPKLVAGVAMENPKLRPFAQHPGSQSLASGEWKNGTIYCKVQNKELCNCHSIPEGLGQKLLIDWHELGGACSARYCLVCSACDPPLIVMLKSVVSLYPPWNRIFRGEAVTLTCNGDKSLDDNSTKWTRDGIALAETTSHLEILNATFQHSGQYQCQSPSFNQSDPVYLEVFSDWLLLQVSPNVVTEGKPFFIRCHVWKNWDAYKVIYYKNGKGLKYWYENHNISITKATLEDSGTYHCEGDLKPRHYVSGPINITVIRAHQRKHWIPFFIPLLVVILFAVDTGLFISTQKQFIFILKIKKTKRGTKL